MTNIVVLGAGVSGLTSALQLARNTNASITIIAKHMPGDYDIEYASPWAGANYLPFSKPGTNNNTFERNTWPDFEKLARELPEAGIHFQNVHLYRRAEDAKTPTGEWMAELMNEQPWFADVVPNFRALSPSEIPATGNFDGGTTFTSVCINTALYLPWLASQCLKRGVVIRRGVVSHILSAAKLHHSGTPADVVINCTGLSSLTLGGVADQTLYPARGQIVIVRNVCDVMAGTSGTDDGDGDEACYIMHRAAGGGCVLGGCLQANRWESQPDLNLATRIMKRCVALRPELVAPGKGIEGLDVIRHGVGLRPMRKDGIRVEREVLDGVQVVHNYGHGGYGYQTSYGAAQAVERLVEEAVRVKARL